MLAKWQAPLSHPWHSNLQLPRVLETWTSHWLLRIFLSQLITKAIINVWPFMLALGHPSLVILLWVITWWNMIWLTTWLGGNNKFVDFELFGSSMLGTSWFGALVGRLVAWLVLNASMYKIALHVLLISTIVYTLGFWPRLNWGFHDVIFIRRHTRGLAS